LLILTRSSSGRRGRLVHPARPEENIPALYVHDLTGTADASRLLHKPPIIHPSTSQIIPGLKHFHPELSVQLSKKSHSRTGIPFKLITKHEFWRPGEIKTFVAVSYCWPSGGWRSRSRFGKPPKNSSISITPAFLRGLLNYVESCTAIWIDAVCIDQNSASEKAVAIANMDTIYINAGEVVVLLEDLNITQEQERVLMLLAEESFQGELGGGGLVVTEDSVRERISTSCHPADLDDLTVFIKNVLNCRWFTRAWCTQEYQLNERRVFMVVGWKYYSITMGSIFSRACQEMEILQVDVGLIVTNSRLNFFSWGNGLRTPETMTEGSIYQSFCEIASLDSLYWADIISVALNSNGIALVFSGSVHDQGHCRLFLALIALAAGDASVLGIEGLSLCGPGLSRYGSAIRWPSDEEHSWTDFVGDVMPRICSAPTIHRISERTIELDLYVLPSQRYNASNLSIQRARRYYRVCFGALRRAQDRNEFAFQVNTLACVLDCGIVKMLDASRNVMKSLAEYCESILDDLHEHWMTNAISSAYHHLLTMEEMTAVYALNIQKTLARFLLVLSAGEKLFGDVTDLTSQILQLNEAGDRFAILLLPDRQELRSGSLVVPAALNNKSAVSVRRAWVVDQVGGQQPLKGKGYLFGVDSLDLKRDDNVLYSENAVVIGPYEG
jgi:Heterokaryon incompatibility protein (HET)